MSSTGNDKARKSDARRMVKGIVLGGMSSVIAVDFAELCFEALDPMASAVVRGSSSTAAAGGASVIPDPKKLQKDEEKKKNVWKRIVRILILGLTAYLVLTYLV